MKPAPAALWAVVRTEFRMQSRRRAMWLAMSGTGLFFGLIFATANARDLAAGSASQAVGEWAAFSNFFVPIAFGILLADRVSRDQQLHVSELLDSFPAGLSARLWGKWAGAGAATMLPFLALSLGGSVYIAIHLHNPSAIPLGFAAFATINLPALILSAAVCIVLPALIWPPAARVVFAGFWLWAQFPPGRVPTISTGLLAPAGGYATKALFHPRTVPTIPGAHHVLLDLGPLAPAVSTTTAALSITLISVMSMLIISSAPTLIRLRNSTKPNVRRLRPHAPEGARA